MYIDNASIYQEMNINSNFQGCENIKKKTI